MAQSKFLKQLFKRVVFLEKNILPSENAYGKYSTKEQDMIRGYILLVHAEIEFYLESIARDKMQKALDRWMKHNKTSNCLQSVLAFTGNELNYNDAKQDKDKILDRDITHRINRAVKHYFASNIDKNHGIKEVNILNILLPLGVKFADIDSAWLSVMDTFGAFRGRIAHSAYKVQSLIDCKTEKDRINKQILPEIENIDNLIRSLT